MAVGGAGPGRRYATQQVNQAYAVLLSSQFQRFCRDLHSESIDYLTAGIDPRYAILRLQLSLNRQLDSRNPSPSAIGSDFGRFGLDFWGAVRADHALNAQRQRLLEELNLWRNAIAHQDFSSPALGGISQVRLSGVRRWRRACDELAVSFDRVMSIRLATIIGVSPW